MIWSWYFRRWLYWQCLHHTRDTSSCQCWCLSRDKFYWLVLFESLPGQDKLMLSISNTGLVYGISWVWSGKQLIIYKWWPLVPNVNAYLLHHIARLDVNSPGSNVHGANMGPIWGRQDPGGPHVGPMNFAIWVIPAWSRMAAGLKKIILSAMSSMKIC